MGAARMMRRRNRTRWSGRKIPADENLADVRRRERVAFFQDILDKFRKAHPGIQSWKTLTHQLRGGYMSKMDTPQMTPDPLVCPDCNAELRIGVGNAESTLAQHRGKKPCRATAAGNLARAEGLVPIYTPTGELDEEIAAPLRQMGLVELRPTAYYSGDPRFTAYPSRDMAKYGMAFPPRGQAAIMETPWVPVWAVDCVQNALAAGDDPEVALLIYWNAVRDVPDFATSMLGDARLLDKE